MTRTYSDPRSPNAVPGQTQTPRVSHASALTGSHVTQAMPPVPQVLKEEWVPWPW